MKIPLFLISFYSYHPDPRKPFIIFQHLCQCFLRNNHHFPGGRSMKQFQYSLFIIGNSHVGDIQTAKNGADCYSKNGDAVTVPTWQS